MLFRKFTYKNKVDLQRVSALDGLRGWLAFLVFWHHFFIFYTREDTGVWSKPYLPFIDNLGVVSVSIFFMITGFLFHFRFKKRCVRGWLVYFFAKLVRLMPVYYFSVIFIFSIAILKYDGDLIFFDLFSELFKWCILIGDNFGYDDTVLINAGVEWSLRYELFFYLAVPLSLVFFSSINLRVFIIVSLPFFIYFYINPFVFLFNSKFMFFFYSGIFCSLICSNKNLFAFQFNSFFIKVFRLALAFFVFYFPDTLSFFHAVLIVIFFLSIVVFDIDTYILCNYFSLKMAKISYCFYLFHGIFLFLIFENFFISQNNFFIFIPLSLLIAILFSDWTHNVIESRSLTVSKRVNRLIS